MMVSHQEASGPVTAAEDASFKPWMTLNCEI